MKDYDFQNFDSCIKALKDEAWGVRVNAARSLGEMGDERAIEPLLAAATNERTDISAYFALANIGGERVIEHLIKAIHSRGAHYAGVALTRIGEEAVEPLIKSLEVGRGGVYALGKIGDRRATGPLIKVLRDEDGGVCPSVIFALGKIGDGRATGPLIKVLKDEPYAAKHALVQIGDEAVEPLIKVLMDGDVNERSSAVIVLGKIGDARAIKPIIAALGDEDEGVSKHAADVLVEGEWWVMIDGPENIVGVEESLLEVLKGRDLDYGKIIVNEVGPYDRKTSIKLLIDVLMGVTDSGWELDQLGHYHYTFDDALHYLNRE